MKFIGLTFILFVVLSSWPAPIHCPFTGPWKMKLMKISSLQIQTEPLHSLFPSSEMLSVRLVCVCFDPFKLLLPAQSLPSWLSGACLPKYADCILENWWRKSCQGPSGTRSQVLTDKVMAGLLPRQAAPTLGTASVRLHKTRSETGQSAQEDERSSETSVFIMDICFCFWVGKFQYLKPLNYSFSNNYYQ